MGSTWAFSGGREREKHRTVTDQVDAGDRSCDNSLWFTGMYFHLLEINVQSRTYSLMWLSTPHNHNDLADEPDYTYNVIPSGWLKTASYTLLNPPIKNGIDICEVATTKCIRLSLYFFIRQNIINVTSKTNVMWLFLILTHWTRFCFMSEKPNYFHVNVYNAWNKSFFCERSGSYARVMVYVCKWCLAFNKDDIHALVKMTYR